MGRTQPNFDITLASVTVQSGDLTVVRDDLLFGGTKQRAASPFLDQKRKEGAREFVYASPFCGFAQVALAAAGKALGLPVILFCEKDQNASAHAFSRLAESVGAKLFLVDTLAEAEENAANYALEHRDAFKVPLGFDCPEFKASLQEELSLCLNNVKSQMGHMPDVVWVATGSGTVGNVLRDVLPSSTQLNCVDVRVLSADDARLLRLQRRGGVKWFQSPEVFHQPAVNEPPVPSNRHYDAKLWSYLKEEASEGDLWWNIAR